ncbi:MAG: [FeFe] hydrogenase H-cluster maturation GTPase HydF [Eubacteriales bacterium]|nr:[FeFe] hydrogenase H-cluster maturation GTPase HydF [Eubacteriales bacterium]MDD4390004.1 [FeFe] hydrogenase H-cluster maturation GTPase HydF [Eubacteriales bacterium]
MSLNQTPSSNRLHIGFFGKRNSGKSSLINAFTGQEVSIVSNVAGTTTDPVYKPMEIHGLGACTLIDTAGFDDVGKLGESRVVKTKLAAEKTDIAVILFSGLEMSQELEQAAYFKDRGVPFVCVISHSDELKNIGEVSEKIKEALGVDAIKVSSVNRTGIEELKEALIRSIPEGFQAPDITGNLVSAGDCVLLVMPQDIQAPKGRLILPQVQTMRELLDKKCIFMSCTKDNIDNALSALSAPPKLIITDSQIFREVYEKKPAKSTLTSFSILFAAHKGDISYYVESAAAIEALTEDSRVLIAECCTHAPLEEDIGRKKIPALLRRRIGEGLTVDIMSGTDFPADPSEYDLIIQCGACMFNRRYVLSRVEKAKNLAVPMSNYGVVLAYLSGILSDVAITD